MFVVEIAGGAADAGIDEAADADVVADLELRDLGADGFHDTGNLMAGNDRIDGVLPLVADGVDVRVADAGIFDVDDDVVIVRLAAFEGERGKRL
ncbi:hypothetical protein D3C86_1710320 [compost metagenome]